MMRRVVRLLASAVFAVALLAGGPAACDRAPAEPGGVAPTASVPFFARFPSFVTPLATVVITVTGTGISPALVFNLTLNAGVASGSLTLPVGPARTIAVQAFDASGVAAYAGQTTVNVVSGTNPAVAITLAPLTGNVPVTATIGTVVVTLTPATATVRAGTTLALTSGITDGQGTAVPGTITFATARPPAAVVSAAGVVTALDTGTVQVAASAFGATAQMTLTVTPGTTLRGVTLSPTTLTSTAGGTVTASVTGADAGSGLDSVRVALSDGATTRSCVSLAPVAGTRNAGTFACPITIAAGAAAGAWTVSGVQLFWTQAGTPRTTDLSAAAVLARGVLAALTVTP